MSIDIQNAIDGDMAVIKEDGTKDYVDNQPLETGYIEAEHVEIAEVAKEKEPPKTTKTVDVNTAKTETPAQQTEDDDPFNVNF